MRLVIAVCTTLMATPVLAEDLSAAEIKAELVGPTLSWWQDGSWVGGLLTLRPNGAAQIIVETPREASEDGRWSLEGNRICTLWPSLRAGQEKGYSVRRGQAGHFITSGGNVFEIREAGV